MNLDNGNPDKPFFHITMDLVALMEPPLNEEGTEWLASFAYQTLVCVHSKGAYLQSGSAVSTAESGN